MVLKMDFWMLPLRLCHCSPGPPSSGQGSWVSTGWGWTSHVFPALLPWILFQRIRDKPPVWKTAVRLQGEGTARAGPESPRAFPSILEEPGTRGQEEPGTWGQGGPGRRGRSDVGQTRVSRREAPGTCPGDLGPMPLWSPVCPLRGGGDAGTGWAPVRQARLHSPLGPGSPSSPVGPRYPGGPRAPGWPMEPGGPGGPGGPAGPGRPMEPGARGFLR